MRKGLLMLSLLILVNGVFAQVFTATYDFTNVASGVSGTTDPTPPPTAAGLTFGSFTSVGVALQPNASGRFSFVGWDLGATTGSDVFTGSLNAAKYYEVTVTPLANYTIDLNSITFTSQRSGTGIRQYAVRSSSDAYAANLAASISPANPNLSVVATNIFQVLDAATGANNGNVITLDASYDNLSAPVTFRIYGWNAESAAGSFGIDNVVFNGVATFTGLSTTFYSKPAGNLTDVTTWGSNTDGTGTQPADFITDGQTFNVVNRVSVTLDANWTVSGAASKVIVGDGLSPTTLILPAAAALTGTADVTNLSTLQIINSTLPTIGSLALGSTVEYAQTASPFVVPTGNTYHHLKLTGNTKTFASGSISVNGNLVVDNVTGFNGSATPFSTVNLAGNFTLMNAAAFEPIATGDGNRMTLVCTGSGGQTLAGGDFYIFRLQTPAAGLNNIVLSSANLILGNPSGGGFDLRQAAHTLTIGGNTLTLHGAGSFNVTNLGTISGSSTANLIVDKTAGAVSVGSIGFTTGFQLLNNLTYNCTSGASTTLTLNSSLTVSGVITLTAGRINVGTSTLTSSGTIAGGSTASYIQTASTGVLRLPALNGTRVAPIGNSTYNPLTVTNASSLDWDLNVEDNVLVTDIVYASNVVKAVQRTWNITPSVIPTPTGADLVFQYDDSDPTQIGVSFNIAENVQIWRKVLSDWISVGVAQVPTGTGPGVRTASISNWSSYSPFAISNISGPLPVDCIIGCQAQKQNGKGVVSWNVNSCADVSSFEIQRSVNRGAFTTIGTVSPYLGLTTFNYTDDALATGTNLYRIKVNRVTGGSKFSNTVAIINGGGDLFISQVSPNPAHDQAWITVSAGKKSTASFTVFNQSGQPVKQWQSALTDGSNRISLDMLNLPAGNYTLSAVSGENRTVYRFVKQ